MTSADIDLLTKEIIAGLEAGADIAAALNPELVPFIVLGKALDKMVPGLATSVNSWIDGNPPTDDEKTALRLKLSVLADPNNP